VEWWGIVQEKGYVYKRGSLNESGREVCALALLLVILLCV
jgi:hypothetical protein